MRARATVADNASGVGGRPAWLDLREGVVTVKNPFKAAEQASHWFR